MPQNPQIHLVSRPQGEPLAENFQLVVQDTPALTDQQVLVKHEYLSLDPYMRGRMSDGPSYAEPVAVGGVMVGGTVSRVLESRVDGFVPGDVVLGNTGWQSHAAVAPGASPLIGASILSPGQQTGSLLTLGVGSGGQLVTLGNGANGGLLGTGTLISTEVSVPPYCAP